jgi:hypothetical protein
MPPSDIEADDEPLSDSQSDTSIPMPAGDDTLHSVTLPPHSTQIDTINSDLVETDFKSLILRSIDRVSQTWEKIEQLESRLRKMKEKLAGRQQLPIGYK